MSLKGKTVGTERAVDDSAPSRETGTAAAPRPASASDAPRWSLRLLAAALLALLALVGVVVVSALRPDRPSTLLAPKATEPPPPTDTDAPFPSETASDVVSYSDHVALVTALTEADAPSTTSATTTEGERILMRDVTFRVDAVLWSRPGAPTAPATFSARWWGGMLHDGKQRPFIVSGAPVVFLGAQYVMPIAYDGTGFTVLQPFAVFRFNEGAVSLEGQGTPLAQELVRGSSRTIADVSGSAVPDAKVAKYRHLPPRARLAAVTAARASEGIG